MLSEGAHLGSLFSHLLCTRVPHFNCARAGGTHIMGLSPEMQHMLRMLRTVALLIVAGLLLGALFYIPKEQISVGMDRARQAYSDGTALAFVNTQMSLLSVILSDLRAGVIVPLIHVAVGTTAFLSAMVASDRLYHFYVALYWRYISRVKPEDLYSHQPLPDMKSGAHQYPTVVVQLPMFNEREVCRQVIDCACEIEWPRDALMVQVLDDSTDEVARERIQDAVASWRERGVNITYKWRSNRQGYKAGAMAEAMPDIQGYEFIAIFDADFHPDSDFLLKTIPYLRDNSDVGFVQARWTYANGSEVRTYSQLATLR